MGCKVIGNKNKNAWRIKPTLTLHVFRKLSPYVQHNQNFFTVVEIRTMDKVQKLNSNESSYFILKYYFINRKTYGKVTIPLKYPETRRD
jgi:hypothetical protein